MGSGELLSLREGKEVFEISNTEIDNGVKLRGEGA